RWADGRPERIAEFAAEFARLKVDVVVTTGTSVPAVRQDSASIPIVFAIASDPIGAGLVTNLARPRGNITGLSQLAADLSGKRLEILREILPPIKLLAVLGNAANQITLTEMQQVQQAARLLGFDISLLDVRRAGDI